MGGLDTTGMSLTSAHFISSSSTNVGKKRRAIEYVLSVSCFCLDIFGFRTFVDRCATDSNTSGDRFSIVLSFVYPRNCYSDPCRTKFNSMAQYNIQVFVNKTNMVVPFTNNQKRNVQMSIYSVHNINLK